MTNESEGTKPADEKKPAHEKKRKGFPYFACFFLLVFLLFVWIYQTHPDWAYAVTLYPSWLWALPFLLVHLLSMWRRKGKLLIFALWIGFGLIYSEVLAVARVLPPKGGGFSVITVNCAGGEMSVVHEALALKPDLLLLQESPPAKQLEELGAREGYSVAAGRDASILAKGALETAPLYIGTSNYVSATWTTPSGERVHVASVRLAPPVFRLDYWNRDMWRELEENKNRREEELREVMARVREQSQGLPLVVGGDFNSPPDPEVFAPLREVARDAFRANGRGWYGTAVNEQPLVRIDQIWVGQALDVLDCRARKTQHSDHRLVRAVLQ